MNIGFRHSRKSSCVAFATRPSIAIWVFGVAFCFLGFSCSSQKGRHEQLLQFVIDNDYDGLRQSLPKDYPIESLSALLWRASAKADARIIRLLLDSGALTNTMDEFGWTPLMLSAAREDPEIIELLLAAGADINAQDDEGSTPLMWAVEHNRPAAARFLLREGADHSLRNAGGQTALDLARVSEESELISLFEQ